MRTKTLKTALAAAVIAISTCTLFAPTAFAEGGANAVDADSIKFGRNQITIVGQGTADAMAYAASGPNLQHVPGVKLRYSSSNPRVATVDSQGIVQSHSKMAAKCTITVTARGGLRSTIKVRVIKALTSKSYNFVAHRGDIEAAPENTTASIVMAALNGYKTTEFDVWETYSGDLVVLHDQNMKRMYGVDKDIRELNTSNAASPNYYGNFKIASGSNLKQYRGLTVPSFEEMIRLASGFGINVTVHIKNPDDDPLSQEGLEKIVETIDLYGMKNKVALTSNKKATTSMLCNLGSYPVFFPLEPSAGYNIKGANYLNELKRAASDAAKMDCKLISVKYYAKTPFDLAYIDYCHALGLSVDTWGVTSKKRACLLIDMGVDSITLDKKLFG